MKKNFMAIASLLIAAMLLVVSCAPEANVEGKVEDGLVEAVIGLGRSAKDITITSGNANATITYKYKMTPAWSSDNTGAPIYGKVDKFKEIPTDSNGKVNGTYTINDTVSSVSLGKVTPGLWNIEVNGYCKVDNVDKLVLQGKASAYFNGTKGEKATVFVAPVSSSTEDVQVTIKLKMQDLEGAEAQKLNKVKYSFTNLNGGVAKEATMNPKAATETSPANVKEYEATVSVRSGFNTVTFSLPGYEVTKDDGTKEVSKGGITKTFLAIPGVSVEITGSVTPAEFKEGNAEIVVLNMNSGSITVESKSDTDPSITTETYNADTANPKTVNIYTLDSGADYKFTYTPANNTDAIKSASENGYNPTREYRWYVGSFEKTGTDKTAKELTFNESSPGDYNVTCVEIITFTKGSGENKVTHMLQASTTFEGVVRVL